MVLGYFGKTPVEPDPEIVALASKQLGLEPTKRNPREINDEDPTKGLAVATKRLQDEGLEVNDENIFVVSTCLDKGIAFLKGDGPLGIRKNAAEAKPKADKAADDLTVQVNGKSYQVHFDGDKATVDGVAYDSSDTTSEGKISKSKPTAETTPVTAQLAAKVFKLETAVGNQVAEGDLLLVLEALKMEIEVRSPSAGTVVDLPVSVGQQVQVGETIAAIG